MQVQAADVNLHNATHIRQINHLKGKHSVFWAGLLVVNFEYVAISEFWCTTAEWCLFSSSFTQICQFVHTAGSYSHMWRWLRLAFEDHLQRDRSLKWDVASNIWCLHCRVPAKTESQSEKRKKNLRCKESHRNQQQMSVLFSGCVFSNTCEIVVLFWVPETLHGSA